MKRILLWLLLLVAAGCVKVDPVSENSRNTTYYGNLFSFNIMKAYYLWEEEMADGFSSWTYGTDPFKKVESMRYKDAAGNAVDKWTTLYEDCSVFLSSVTGNGNSLGFDFGLYYTDKSHAKLCAVVLYTYAGSPAAKAGLKRGDVILTLDGKEMTPDNYVDLVNEKLRGGGSVSIGLMDGGSVSLKAVRMYENPVHTALTLEAGGKKLGYLHFTNFTMDACRDLEEAFRRFKEDGIEEMVLDLRYNGGGYTLTSAVLGSMLVPPSELMAGSVFTREVYNKQQSKYREKDLDTHFSGEFEIGESFGSGKYTVSPALVNPGIRKLWVITTGGTASASEALICGLKPYLDISLVGEKTYGKFCGGFLIQAEDFFSAFEDDDVDFNVDEGAEVLSGWGLYVIASRYSDKDGVTLSMPDGIPADYPVSDNPLDGYQLGDPSETMLAKVLALSTGVETKASGPVPTLDRGPAVHRTGFGVLLHTNP